MWIRRLLMLSFLCLLLVPMVRAQRSKRPASFTDLTDINQLSELNQTLSDFWNITNGRYNLDHIETNPQDSRKGIKGDLVYATFGGTDHLCVSTSFPIDKDWTCIDISVLDTCPGGSDKQVQFNDNGNCGGDTALTWEKNLNVLLVNGSVGIGADVSSPTLDATLEIDPANVSGVTVETVQFKSDNQVIWLTSGITVVAQRQNQFFAPTIHGVSGDLAETVTDAATVYIDNHPSGSNITITNAVDLMFGNSVTNGNAVVSVQDQTASNTDGRGLLISTADGVGSGDGGDLNLTTGDAGTNGDAGQITLTGGDATGGNNEGGFIQVFAGEGFGAGSGGQINLFAGNGGTTGLGGNITISGGTGGATAQGGNLALSAGSATTTGDAGSVTISGGTSGGGAGSDGGSIFLDVADGSGGGADGLIRLGTASSANQIFLNPRSMTADRTLTFADSSGAIFISTLTTNSPNAANAIWGISNALVFEGDNANGFETTLTPIDPTADRTITLPNVSGIVVVSTTGLTDVTSGVWTPTSNNIANLTSSTAAEGQYIRVGSVVTGSIQLTVDPTLSATATELELDLPVASDFGATSDASGACGGSDVVSEVAGIRADATSNEMEVLWVTTSLASHELDCAFSYEIK